MSELSALERAPAPLIEPLFTILGGTTIPDRAAIVRAHCREGSLVELRRQEDAGADGPRIEVWLECRPFTRWIKVWKNIGHVPRETAAALMQIADVHAAVVAYGTVRKVYAPASREEAVVTVEIRPQTGVGTTD